MSWDIYVQDIPEDVKHIDDMHTKYDSFKPSVIGMRSDIIRKIKEIVPEADFPELSWGIIEGDGFSIEVNMGKGEECEGFAFHVRGGDSAAFVIFDILTKLEFRAFDPSSETGLFEIGSESVLAMQKWRRFRKKVLRKTKKTRNIHLF